jgi:DNA repair protein RadC
MRTHNIKESLEHLKNHWAVGELEVTYKTDSKTNIRVNGPEDAFRIFRSMWDESLIEIQEQFSAIFLNRNKRVIGFRNIATGDGSKALVDIPFLLSLALLCRADSVIIAHNHPSNNTAPSRDDEELTSEIKYSLKRIHVKLDDALIITGNKGFSMINEMEITLGEFEDLHHCDTCSLLLHTIQCRDEELEHRKRMDKLAHDRITELKKQLNNARKTIRDQKRKVNALIDMNHD